MNFVLDRGAFSQDKEGKPERETGLDREADRCVCVCIDVRLCIDAAAGRKPGKRLYCR